MQQPLELDMHSPIVIRALRIRANFHSEGIPSSFSAESERAGQSQESNEVVSLFTQKVADLPYACASKEGSLVHSWEKLSIRS